VVDPTPTIGMVGLIDKEEHITTQWFKNAGDVIILVGGTCSVASQKSRDDTEVVPPGLGGSRFLKVCHGKKIGPPPGVDLAHEIKVQEAVRELIRSGLVKSAHDCSEGGLAVALAECCFNPEGLLGAEVDLNGAGLAVSAADEERVRTRAATAQILFNESQSRIVISVGAEDVKKTLSVLRERDVPFLQLGKVGGDELRVAVNNETFRWPVTDLYDDWWNAIRRAVESDSAERVPSL
jgi:phosphoribosylformylglycinamidine synthase